MRLLVLLALLAGPVAAQPVWDLLPASPYHGCRSEDIAFPDAEHGWAVDGDGRVHRTEDGGDTWRQTARLEGYLRATTFASPTVGWIGVLNSPRKLYETRDGGRTFQDVTSRISPAVEGICSLFAVSEEVVYGAGVYYGPATLIKTTDGGATWTARSLAPHLDTVIDVHFFDEQRGLAVGGTGDFSSAIRPRVIGTEDGGETWTVRHTVDVSRGWGWKLSFPTADVGYMSVEKTDGDPTALVLKTTDGGQTWTELSIPNAGSGSMQAVGFLTPEIGWVSGRGTVSQTLDGGLTWTQLDFEDGLDSNVNRFRFLDGGLGFASGYRIYRLDARTTAGETPPDGTDAIVSVGPNPARGEVRVRVRAAGPAQVDVLDALGRHVATLPVDSDGRATWAVPEGLAPGVYVVRLQTDRGVWTRPIVTVR